MAGERLVRAMKQAAKDEANSTKNVDLLFGKVTSILPLKIEVEAGYEISNSLLLLSSLCTEQRLGELLLWRGLEVGDTVRLLRVHRGKLFYVLEREGGLTI